MNRHVARTVRGKRVKAHHARSRTISGCRTALLCLGASVLGTGCLVGPDYEVQDASVPDNWLRVDDERIEVAQERYVRWWECFEDPVLNDLVEMVHDQNLTLRAAGARIMASRAVKAGTVGALFPQLQQASGSHTKTRLTEETYPQNDIASVPSGAPVDREFRQTDVGFDAAWELDFWGRYRRAIEANSAALDQAIASYDDILVSLIAEVASNYVNYRTAQERLEIARRNVGIQQETLEMTEARFRGGAITELDVTDARSALANTEATIPSLEQGLTTAQYRICVLLGTLPADLSELLTGEHVIPATPETVVVGIPADLLRRRPDVRAAERAAAAQSARIGVAKADFFPAISLFGTIGYSAEHVDDFGSDAVASSYGPSFSWPLFNYGRIANNVRTEDALFQASMIDYRNAVLNAAAEVESNVIRFFKTREEAAYIEESARMAERSFEIAMTQYTQGAIDFVRVNDAQTLLAQQEDRVAATLGQNAIGLIGVYKAMGGGWEIREGREFLPEETKEEMGDRTRWGGMLDTDESEYPATPEYPGFIDPNADYSEEFHRME